MTAPKTIDNGKKHYLAKSNTLAKMISGNIALSMLQFK